MAFPHTLDPAAPAGSDSPRLGDNQIRDLKQALADILGLPVSPTTITAAIGSTSSGGKLTLTNALWNGDAIGVAYGGTNIASYAIGDLLYASGATTLAKLADVAVGSYLRSGGVGVAPTWGPPDAPSSDSVNTEETTTTTTPTDLTTPGPAVTVTISSAGKALVLLSCSLKSGTSGSAAAMGFAVSGASTVAAAAASSAYCQVTSYAPGHRAVLLSGLTAGSNTFTAKYWNPGGTGGYFVYRSIVVFPY